MRPPSQLMALLTTIGLLLLCAVAVVKAHRLIRHESGLTSTDTLRRLWSKAEQIIFQPIALPAVFSVVVGLGSKAVFSEMALCILQVFDLLGPHNRMAEFIISGLCQALSTLAAVFLYRNCNGQRPRPFLFVYVAVAAILFVLQILAGDSRIPQNSTNGMRGDTDSPQPPPSGDTNVGELHGFAFWAVRIGIDVGASVLCGLWALGQNGAPRFNEIASSQGLAAPRFPFVHLVGWSAPLMVVTALHYGIAEYYDNDGPPHYLFRVVARISELTLIVACAFVGMWSTHRRVMAGCYSWHWPSVLLTGIPVAVIGLMQFVYSLMFLNPGVLTAVMDLVIVTTIGSASGFIGAISFLAIVARYAQIALNGGHNGESNLIVEDDSDLDDNEYEV